MQNKLPANMVDVQLSHSSVHRTASLGVLIRTIWATFSHESPTLGPKRLFSQMSTVHILPRACMLIYIAETYIRK